MPNLFDTLLERMEGRRYSNYFSCFCPFDTHKSPALLVYDDGMFVCLSCGKKGNLKYLDKATGSHFIPQRNDTVSRVLPRWRSWEEKYGDLEGIVQAAHRSLKRFPQFQTYFKRRKIYEYVDEGKLGYLDGWVTFPIFSSEHRLIDIVVRSISNHGDVRYVVHPDIVKVRPLYSPSWEDVNKSKTVYVVYGIIDAISLHLAGLPSLTGTTGKSLNADLLKPLGKRFIIVPDAGEEHEAYLLANKLGWRAKVKEISYPDNTKDTDDIRRLFGNEYLLQTLGA
jgi:DNA primase